MLRAWMTETNAATPPTMATPRLSFACLRELRQLVDAQGVSLSPSLEAIRNDGDDDATACPKAATRSSQLAADDVVPRLFDPVRRAEIVSLLKALLSDRLVPVRIPEDTDDD